MPAESTDDLLPRLRAGDEAAFTEFVRAYSGRMLAVARRIVHDEHDAADAVQDGFLSAFKSLDRFEGNSSPGTWLHRIVVNACLMKLRSRSRRHDVLLEDLLPKYDQTGHHVDPPCPWSRSSDEALLQEEARDRIRDSINRLPSDYRDIVLLRDIEGLDTEQTAELLQVSAAVVRTRLHRARQALRKLLEPLFVG